MVMQNHVNLSMSSSLCECLCVVDCLSIACYNKEKGRTRTVEKRDEAMDSPLPEKE